MNQAFAFLFPGQGSQIVGMGREFCEDAEEARARFEEAEQATGLPLRQLCFEGPEDELKQTIVTQPALFTVSAIAADALGRRGIAPACAAGHSLGEYGALYAAGALDFATGIRLISARARAMTECAEANPGGMAAVIGLEIPVLEEACAQACAEGEEVVIANDNSVGQVVISGHTGAVERACAAAKVAGAKRALPLPVSGAFHSPLMAPAAKAMERILAGADIREPRLPFYPNVLAEDTRDPAVIRRALADQITGRVRWVETIRRLAADGHARAIEVGPGNVLAGLVKRIDREMSVASAATPGNVAAI